MNPSLLQDEQIFLRAPEPSDIPLMYEWENDTEIWSFGNQSAPFSMKNIEDFVINYNADIFASRQLRLMVCTRDGNKCIGIVDLYDFDPVNSRAAVGVLISPPYRKSGFAFRALSLLERYAVSRIDLHQLWAVVAVDNMPSRNLFSSLDYAVTGRLRSWIRDDHKYRDAFVFQKLLIR